VLGTALSDPDTMVDAEVLFPHDFTGCHQTLFGEMLALHRRGALEMRALVESLRQSNELETLADPVFDAENYTGATGEAYLSEILAARGGAMPEYVDHVMAAAIRREALNMSALIAAEAQDEGIPAEELLDNAERRAMALRRDRAPQEGMTLGDILGVYIPRIEGMRTGTVQPAWVPELPALRSVLDYVDQEDLVYVAARPGEGKSSWMRYEAFHLARRGRSAAIFNLENSDTEYAKGALALYTGIDNLKLKNPSLLTEEELQQVRDAAGVLANWPLHIITLGGPSIKEIERRTRVLMQKFNIGWLGIDYVQLVQNGETNENANITITSQALRAMALRYKLPITGASQLSREIVRRGGDPQLSDLRGSGSLEQDGKIIIFPRPLWDSPTEEQLRQFPWNLEPDGSLSGVIRAMPLRMFVLKNTNGPIGTTAPFLWIKSTGNFLSLTTRSLSE